MVPSAQAPNHPQFHSLTLHASSVINESYHSTCQRYPTRRKTPRFTQEEKQKEYVTSTYAGKARNTHAADPR